METAARTSDQYNEEAPEDINDRHPEEEDLSDGADPITELYVEAVRAMYGHTEPSSPDSTPATERAVAMLKNLTGSNCEAAYRLCPGRYMHTGFALAATCIQAVPWQVQAYRLCPGRYKHKGCILAGTCIQAVPWQEQAYRLCPGRYMHTGCALTGTGIQDVPK